MRKTVEEIFMKMQMSQEDSKQAADVLIYADPVSYTHLRAHET